jgi:hypothetical protein
MNKEECKKYYDRIQKIANNRFLVAKNGKFGLLDENFNVLICRIYDFIEVSIDDNNIFNCIMDKTKCAYIIKDKIIDVNCDLDYEESFYFGNNIISVKNKNGFWENKELAWILNY